ncbi:hypothetical protein AB0N17_44500 [Streptomyces sp. NPDC051133]|uniref:hypothetical protein n=1 Tax=Streptomyces sp. NPDC051133 TaxID=3155521 RepID=UPI003429465D
MSLRPVPAPSVPEATARVARAAFRKGCLAMRIRDELGPLSEDEAPHLRQMKNPWPTRLRLSTWPHSAVQPMGGWARDHVRLTVRTGITAGLLLAAAGLGCAMLPGLAGILVGAP